MRGQGRFLGRIAMAAGAVMAFATQVSLQDAQSNVASWYDGLVGLIGDASPPAWLNDPNTDKFVLIASIGLFTIGAIPPLVRAVTSFFSKRVTGQQGRRSNLEETIEEIELSGGTRPDYYSWMMLSHLELWQAACLWADIEPTYPVPKGRPQAHLRRIKAAIADNTLQTALPPHIRAKLDAIKAETGTIALDLISDNLPITYNVLAEYADGLGENPNFIAELLPARSHESSAEDVY